LELVYLKLDHKSANEDYYFPDSVHTEKAGNTATGHLLLASGKRAGTETCKYRVVVLTMTKNQMKNKKSKKTNRSIKASVETSENAVPGIPRPSGGESFRPRYNPSWNPQYLKVCREMQYSVPAADVVSPYIQDPSVGCLAANLSYNTGTISFRIGDVYNVSEYGVLFDQYRIAAAKVEFHYMTAADQAATTTVNNQQVCTALLYEDYDDSTAPAATLAGWNAILESGRARKHMFPGRKSNTLTYTLNPKYLQVDVDNAAGTTGRGTGDGWLDGSTATDVIWRGLKWALQANPGSTTLVHYFRVYITYYLCFRQRQ